MTYSTCCISKAPIDPMASYRAAISENPTNAAQSNGRKNRTVGEHRKFWRPGRTLKIAIEQYDEGFDIVKNAINKWSPHVNLKFEFIELSDNDELYEGDIRIVLSPYYNAFGSSELGTDALLVPANKPTMLLGTRYTWSGYESHVMHEFGHALGLEHEHQHPDADIPWDKAKTYEWYQRLYGMSKDMVDANALPRERNPNRTYTPYDRHSIMHYEIANECTIGDRHQPRNIQLSPSDIRFALRMYP